MNSDFIKKNRAIAIFLVVSIITISGVYFFLYRKKSIEIETLQYQLMPLLKQISDSEKMILRVPNPKREIKLLEERIDRLTEQAASKEEIPKIIQQLAQKTSDLNIDVISIVPREDLKALAGQLPQGVSKVYIEIRVGCAYKLFSTYISEITNLTTLFTLEDLLIERDPDELTDILKIRLILSTYVLA